MGEKTGIEWTESTWNPATGCTLVSPGCKNCFAKRVANRMKGMGSHKYRNGFDYTQHPDAIDQPTRWRKPRMVFVNSMSDLFHEQATEEFLRQVFWVMERTPHTYQILTKRPERMVEFIKAWTNNFAKPVPDNIWLGVSVELQAYVNRISILRMIPCRVRFVSFEPLLGPIEGVDLAMMHWAIIGGESGPDYRPMEYEWANGLIQQCEAQGVPAFFKQWGGRVASAGGRTINGRTYDGYPAGMAEGRG